ncbi:MAG: Kdo hydroxylase family protein [Candidatus Sumerlaeia bacterium]|nr:Kdo hydroxylase family protein [Candidatus Sumerlaeia bacterium]
MSQEHITPEAFEMEPKDTIGQRACEHLERGGILYFPTFPFPFAKEDAEFLLTVRQSKLANHKNVAYRPLQDRITGFEGDEAISQRLHKIMRDFSKSITEFADELLAPYSKHRRLDYASFRPLQEEGRQIRQSARNDLLHLDNFPTRPTHGARILRIFININPDEARKWITGAPIHDLVNDPRQGEAIKSVAKGVLNPLTQTKLKLSSVAKAFKVPVTARSSYDEIMIRYHHHLKADEEYQKNGARNFWQFPPGSCWAVYTDSVPHAVLAGQYAMEQTYMVEPEGMLLPELSPIRVLEKYNGAPLARPRGQGHRPPGSRHDSPPPS